MIVWDKLEIDTFDFLHNQKSKGTEDTAEFFASSYHQVMMTAMDPLNNLVILKDVSILKSAWLKVFGVMLASPKDLKSIPYNFIGAAMIKYWTGNIVSPLIPHSGAVTGTLNVIVFPGNPVPVGLGIYNSFKEGDAAKVASELIGVYKDHLKGIQGLFTGITPAPSPIVVPWTGLK
tara:strand:+ start:2934 stop:3461 length:528 start_codon:yes stop_codon:yes gene_type:complete